MTSGEHVVLHLWLAAFSSSNATTVIQGFGFFEPIDRLSFSPHAAIMLMPPGAFVDLQGQGFLYIKTPSAQIPMHIMTDPDPDRLFVPFHVECSLNTSDFRQEVYLHVRDWRRFLSLPLSDMVAKPPAAC